MWQTNNTALDRPAAHRAVVDGAHSTLVRLSPGSRSCVAEPSFFRVFEEDVAEQDAEVVEGRGIWGNGRSLGDGLNRVMATEPMLSLAGGSRLYR